MMMMMLFLFVCAWPSCKSATLTSSFELRKSWLPFVGRVCRWMAARFFKDFRHSNRMKKKPFHQRAIIIVNEFETFWPILTDQREWEDTITNVYRALPREALRELLIFSKYCWTWSSSISDWMLAHCWVSQWSSTSLFDSPVSLTTHTSTRDLQT